MNWWLDRQKKDAFVKKRDQEQLRSRAAFKLIELIDKFKLKSAKGPFVDLGAAPGGWTEILIKTYPGQRIVAVDLLPIKPLNGAVILQGDFTDSNCLTEIDNALEQQKAGAIFSDMAPNFSGQPLIEQAKMFNITELLVSLSQNKLRKGGFIVQKVFHGSEFQSIIQAWKNIYKQVDVFKPISSRAESSEVYLVIRNS